MLEHLRTRIWVSFWAFIILSFMANDVFVSAITAVMSVILMFIYIFSSNKKKQTVHEAQTK